MTEDVGAVAPTFLPNRTGAPGQPFSSTDLLGLIAKGRALGLSDEELAIQLQLTPEELARVAAGGQAGLGAVLPAWRKRMRTRGMAR